MALVAVAGPLTNVMLAFAYEARELPPALLCRRAA
jgi:hypothetical protein